MLLLSSNPQPLFDPNYLMMLVAGIASATALYFFNSIFLTQDTAKNKTKAAAVFFAAAVLALPSTYLVGYLTQPSAHALPFLQTIGLAFGYFFCAVFLFLYSAVFLRLLGLDVQKHLNAAVPPVILLSAVCRIGCIFLGSVNSLGSAAMSFYIGGMLNMLGKAVGDFCACFRVVLKNKS